MGEVLNIGNAKNKAERTELAAAEAGIRADMATGNATKADKATPLSASGLARVNRSDLGGFVTISVVAATEPEALAGTATDKAMTPAATKAAIDEAVTELLDADLGGLTNVYATKADATAALGAIAANAVIEVAADEGRSGHRVRYRKESGVLVFKADLDANTQQQIYAAGAGVKVADGAGLVAAAPNYREVVLEADVTVGEPADLTLTFDAVVRGEGRARGFYRRPAIPHLAPSDHMAHCDLTPVHLPAMNAASTPVAVLVGDSLATYFANSLSRGGMLSTCLERELRQQLSADGKGLIFHNRAIGGQSFGTLAGVPTLSVWPAWYSNHANAWLSYVEALTPDVLFISMGMNTESAPASAMRAVIAEIQSWAKVPDIVLCTNLNPSPSLASAGWNTVSEQEDRDRTAGLVRSYAKRHGIGLLDFHRKACMARDGFDPTSNVIEQGVAATASGDGNFYAPENVLDYQAVVEIDVSKMTYNDTGDLIVFNVGPGSEDVIQLSHVGATSSTWRINLFYGSGGDGEGPYATQDFLLTPNGAGKVVLKLEKTGNFVTLSDHTSVLNYGETTPALWSGLIVARGGRFQPFAKMTPTAALAVTAITFDLGRPRLNVPSIKDSRLWGDGVSAVGTFGGSGYNHPSSYAGPYVYEPVLRSSRLV